MKKVGTTGLQMEEPVIFERSVKGRRGVAPIAHDVPEVDVAELIPKDRIEPPSIYFQQVDDAIKLTVGLQNLGTAKAENVFVAAGFEFGGREPEFQQITDTFKIDHDYEAIATFYLDVPDRTKYGVNNLLIKINIDGNEEIFRNK